MQICTKCGKEKEINEFHIKRVERKKGVWEKHRTVCKKCQIEINKENYKKREKKYKQVEINKELIISKRKELGYSRARLAEITGINFYAITNIETKYKKTYQHNIDKIYEALGLK